MKTLQKIGIGIVVLYGIASGLLGFYPKKEIKINPVPFPLHGELSMRAQDTFDFYVPPYPLLPRVSGINFRKGLKAMIVFVGDSAEYHQTDIGGTSLDTVLESRFLEPVKYVPRLEAANSLENLIGASKEPLFKEGVDVYANGNFFHVKATLCLDKNPVIEYRATFRRGDGEKDELSLYAEYKNEGNSIKFHRYRMTIMAKVKELLGIRVPITIVARPVKSSPD